MKNNFIDNNEKKDIEIWENVDILKIENDKDNIKNLKSVAKEHIKSNETKINMRISKDELEKIKQRAQKEGLKYQTFIKSVLHKYMTGQLIENKTELSS